MSKILKNQLLTNLLINDTGITLPASPGTYIIPPVEFPLWAGSSDIVTEVGSGNVIVNDGSSDLSISDGIDLIKGIFPKNIGILSGDDFGPIGRVGDSLKIFGPLTDSELRANPVPISGSVTANAGLNLNTSALNLEATQLLIKSKTDNLDIGLSTILNKLNAGLDTRIDQSGYNVDAFGRILVSSMFTQFEYTSQYDKGPLLWDEKLETGGTSTHIPADSSIDLAVTTSNGSSVIRQTKRYLRYYPGKAQSIMLTFVMGTGQTGTSKEVGYGDAENGIFLEQQGTTLNILFRSKSSGSVTETRVPQSSWNKDKLDGTGASGVTLNVNTTALFKIDFTWLAAGRTRLWFMASARWILVHEGGSANFLSTSTMTSANLPVRYRIFNTQAVAATNKLKVICVLVANEGPPDIYNYQFSADTGASTRAINAQPLIAVRPKATFNGIVNRGTISILSRDIFLDQPGFFRVFVGATITGGTWTSADTNSIAEFNSTATGFSGGTKIHSGYTDKLQSQRIPVTFKIPLSLDIDGSNPTTYVIVAERQGGGSLNASGAITWEEIR